MDENRYVQTAADRAGLSAGAETLKDNCGLSRSGGYHPGAIVGGTAVPTEAGADVS